jgi:dynein heavy chain
MVTKFYDPKEVTKRLEDGTYVYGLYIEGARWNSETMALDYQKPKILVELMPIVQIIPIEVNKLKLRGTMKVPVYITQDRANAKGQGLCFPADLPTKRHESHWILQGVGMMLNIE